MSEITNLWLHTKIDSDSLDFWYLDYDNGIAKHSTDRPKNESILRWKGNLVDFLQQRGYEILEETSEIIKFKPEKNP